MKVLLDEDLPHKLRVALFEHEVFSVQYMGWSGLKNGELLRVLEEEGFEVLVTGDQNLVRQQNLKGRRLGIVVLSSQEWMILRGNLGAISRAISRVNFGEVQVVACSGSAI